MKVSGRESLIRRGSSSCRSAVGVVYKVVCWRVMIAARFRVLQGESRSASCRTPSLLRLPPIMRSSEDGSLMLLYSQAA